MPEGVGYITRREEELALLAALKNQRQSHEADWKDIGDHVLSRRVQFVKSDTNRGGRRNKKIIDPTGTLAARTLRSGMMGGITSPAREWKRLTTPDPEVAKVPAVKAWLHAVNEAMSTVFLQSNLYNALPIVYGDIGAFGTSAMAVEEDFTDTIRCYTFPLGSYMLGTDDRNVVNVFAREFQMTVRQLISKFGGDGAEPDWTKFSLHVRDLYIRKSLDAWVDVVHIIRPNSNYNPDMLGEHKFQSVYFEAGPEVKKEGDGKYLREGGYDLFNILAPRWETTSGDVYGTECPGFIAVGGIKALQLQHKRKAQAVEKMINPAMVGPTSLREVAASLLPGSLTYLDEREGQKGFRPAHEVNISIADLRQDMQEEQALIKRVFFEDLFLMLASLDKRQMTAAEVHERSSEKLLALGPVLEQLNQDLLDPLIKITFDIMVRQGLIPEPPEEIQGITLKVEYISIMHQAQKSAGLAGIERLTSFVGEVAVFKPEVLDKLNTDELVDRYAEIVGAPPQVILDAETVARIREGRAEAQRKEEERIAIQEGASVAKDLSQADMGGGESALAALMEQSKAGALQ
jgi:hypothetical protein